MCPVLFATTRKFSSSRTPTCLHLNPERFAFPGTGGLVSSPKGNAPTTTYALHAMSQLIGHGTVRSRSVVNPEARNVRVAMPGALVRHACISPGPPQAWSGRRSLGVSGKQYPVVFAYWGAFPSAIGHLCVC